MEGSKRKTGVNMESGVSYHTNRPTAQHVILEQAYDYFNTELFDGALPACMITLNRRPNSRGYYSQERFIKRAGQDATDEIALNPETFDDRTDAEILSTLAHEMCHLWQAHHGKMSRQAYHDRQWAEKMLSVGLRPTDDGTPTGKQTGQSVTHLIVVGGRFDLACRRLLDSGWRLDWQSRPLVQPVAGSGGNVRSKSSSNPKKSSKAKFSCPTCGCNAWGKSGLNLICGDCHEEMIET